jgi:two-component system NtrC family response regulator
MGHPRSHNDRPSVLIVDDDEHICRSLEVILSKAGYKTDTAHTGREALTKLREKPSDVVLLDAKLPDLQGLALIAPIRQRHPTLSIVVITAHGSVETARLALKRGATGYIAKPFGIDEVRTAVAEALGKRDT